MGQAPAARPRDPSDLGFDLWSVEFVAHPYRVYAELRELGPIHYFEPTNQWVVPRYEDVNQLLRDRRFGRTYLHLATHDEMGRPGEPESHGPFWHLIQCE